MPPDVRLSIVQSLDYKDYFDPQSASIGIGEESRESVCDEECSLPLASSTYRISPNVVS